MNRLASAFGAYALILASAAFAQGGDNHTPPAKRISPQEGLAAQVIPKGQTPRLANGVVDLNGLWGGDASWDTPYPRFVRRGVLRLEADQTVAQRASHWKKPNYKPEFWEAVHKADFGEIMNDPHFNCMPSGAPRKHMPSKIVQNEKEVVLIYGDEVRYVPTDGRKRDLDLDSDYDNYGGVPLGHFEGDTLVVESVGFTDKSWLQWTGYIHSANMTLKERFTRKGDVLYYQFTVHDPEFLAEDWVSETFVRRVNASPSARFDEVAPCQENDAEQITDRYFRG